MPKKTKQPHNFHKKLQEHLDERIDTPYGQRPLSFPEIAEKLGVSKSSVTVHSTLSEIERNKRLREIMRIKALVRENKNVSYSEKDIVDIIRKLLLREIGYDYDRMENSRRYTIKDIGEILERNYGIKISESKINRLAEENKLIDRESKKANFLQSKRTPKFIPTHTEMRLLEKIAKERQITKSRDIVEYINNYMKNRYIEGLKKRGLNANEIESELKKHTIRRYNYFFQKTKSEKKSKDFLKTNLFTNITFNFVNVFFSKNKIGRRSVKINAFNDKQKKEILEQYVAAIYKVINRMSRSKSAEEKKHRYGIVYPFLYDRLDYYDSQKSKDMLGFIMTNTKYALLIHFKKEREQSKLLSLDESLDSNSGRYNVEVVKKASSSPQILGFNIDALERFFDKIIKIRYLSKSDRETLDIIKYMIENNYDRFRNEDIRQEIKRQTGKDLSRNGISLRLKRLKSKLANHLSTS